MTTVSWPVPFFHPKIVNNTAPQNYPIWDTFGNSQSGDESQSLLLLINALPDRLGEAFPIEASDHTPGMYDPDADLFGSARFMSTTGACMTQLNLFKARHLSTAQYVLTLHQPEDRVAVLVRNRLREQTMQRTLAAEDIASPPFQDWLKEQNDAGADIFLAAKISRLA
jgi:hypothetical protein